VCSRLWLALVGATLLVTGLAACDDAPRPVGGSLAVAEAMSGDTVGYARADRVRAFAFPADHGPHPDFKTEWWYVTSSLRATDGSGRAFGVQLTLFRSALAPPAADGRADMARASDWATRQLYMAHVAVGDSAAGRFADEERFARGAAGLAGATASPLRAWLGPVEIAQDGPPRPDGAVPLRLAGEADGVQVRLRARPVRPLVLQGDRGLSPKGAGAGNASYYYAQTRMAAEGTLTLADGERVPVAGLAWLDREWSTSALSGGQTGWDWFALHLADGRDLMVYQLRGPDGRADPFSAAAVVRPDGARRGLAAGEFILTPGRTWTSPRGGRYPVRWRVQVPSEGLDLDVRAMLDASELDATVRYWEGSVRVGGSHAGTGFLEMTGYADGAPDR